MFETYTTIRGRVITDPRRIQSSLHGELVSFRVACNSRRRDPDSGEWADGHTLYLEVACWGRLATGVAAVVHKGSSILAHGQVWTNEYTTADGQRRSGLEMKATSLGLDLGAGIVETRPERELEPESVAEPETVAAEVAAAPGGEPVRA